MSAPGTTSLWLPSVNESTTEARRGSKVPNVFQMPGGHRSLEMVTVGFPGNPPDASGFGAVRSAFRIGKFEVTAAQYAAFLNAKAKSDRDGNLWNNDMDMGPSGPGPRCNIRRSGKEGDFSYSVSPDFANRPVNFVSFWDACRFCNWLHNGQGDGDTEDGAYTLRGYRGSNGRTIVRNPGARWFLPNEDEWVKAAYFAPPRQGSSRSEHYWDYPTQSSVRPVRDVSGSNAANVGGGEVADSGSPFTEVGTFRRSPGPFGTYDQAGNVAEWTEVTRPWKGIGPPAARWPWGGSVVSDGAGRRVRDQSELIPVNSDEAYVGFRVAAAMPIALGTILRPEPKSTRGPSTPRPLRKADRPLSPINRLARIKIILNQDSRDICYQAPPGNAQGAIRAWYRRAFAAGVEAFVADVATPDVVVTKDTPTGEVWGARAAASQSPAEWEARYRTIQELARQGTDVLHILVEEGRKANALVLAGMRMGDAHHGMQWQPSWGKPNFPEIALEHPEWCNLWRDGTRDVTLNYAFPEVREHRLRILRELATHYDIDGIELDWMRHCRYFPAGQQRAYLQTMTEFVGQVRGMLDDVARKKGRARLVLGHRVPSTPDEGLGIGIDTIAWAKRGFADYVVPADFQHVDLNVQADRYVRALRGTGCRVYPSFGNTPYSSGFAYGEGTPDSPRRRSRMSTPEQYRALASNWFAWGADGGATYNIINWPAERQRFAREMISILSGSPRALNGPRHYVFLPTWKDHAGGVAPTGRLNAQSLTFDPDGDGRRQVFRFRMADGKDGGKLRGWLRIRLYDAGPGDVFALDLNGRPVPQDRIQIRNFPDGEVTSRPVRSFKTAGNFGEPEDGTMDWQPNVRLEILLEDCPSFRGDNEIGLSWVKRDLANNKVRVMEALEVMVR
ncbi:MAG: SUMF1/EgtB/PvdO family nonheme iron enzyme [Armatimonadota bacterium]